MIVPRCLDNFSKLYINRETDEFKFTYTAAVIKPHKYVVPLFWFTAK